MTIKSKLVISYIAMVILPLILIYITLTLIGNILFGTFPPKGTLSIGFTMDSNQKIMNQYIKNVSQNNNLVLNPKFLATAEKRLRHGIYRTGVVVQKQNRFVYRSRFINPSVLKFLPRDGKIDRERFNEINPDKNFKLNGISNLRFKDGTRGMIYIFGGFQYSNLFAKYFLIFFVFVALIIIALVNGLLSYFVAKSMIKPLDHLKQASEQIKCGNLNFYIHLKTKDEIGQLAIAFEEMRSKLKESIDRQIQYENNRKELFSGISHDLKTPITAIKGYVEGIIDGVADTPEKMAKYIRTIYSKASDLDRLIDELFLFSKLDLKKLPFDFETVDLKAFLTDCMEELSFDLEAKGIHFNFSCNSTMPVNIIADREKLKRVIVNIIENCVKYRDNSKNSKQIRLGLYVDDKTITVHIQDNGFGIKADDLPFIFENFYRADQSRNAATGGSGLGLAIAKRIIEEHRGKIWAESEYGVGTSIFILFYKQIQATMDGEPDEKNIDS